MTATPSAGSQETLCSVFSGAHAEDPGGSAPSWKRLLVLELSKPWHSEIAETVHFPSAVSDALAIEEARGVPTNLQCVAPDTEYSAQGHRRVMLYSRPKGPFASFHKDEFMVPTGETGPLVEALLNSPERLGGFERYRQNTSDVRDVLVCTHGSHDVCCATFGYPSYDELRRRYAPKLAGSLRVWQVSHLGGHRFAPNVVDLPEGRNWVRTGRDEMRALVYRDRPVSELKRSYRGWTGLDTPYEQVAEREAFMREGWAWTGRSISTRLVSVADDGRGAEVRLDFAGPDGAEGAYEATVEQTDGVARVGCPNGEKTGEASQYAVSRLVRLS